MKNRILVIDDDPLVLKSFVKLLIADGYEVISAASYKEAIEAFKNKDFNLILSDIRMPEKNGIETVKEIQTNLIEAGKQDLPIIFITGYAEIGDQLHANFHGEVLSKPIDKDLLLSTIREYL